MIAFLGLAPALDVTYLVPRLQPGTIHRPRVVLALPGGKSLNAARAAATLGADVLAIAPLAGFTGERVRAGFAVPGAELRVVASQGETRACVTVIDEGSAATTEFYETAPPLDAVAWEALAAAVAELQDGWLAVSGSVPADRAEDLAGLLADSADRGIRVAVDSHGAALAAILAACTPAVVKVNRGEAEELLGAGTAAELAARFEVRLARDGGLAVVTDGAAGAVACTGGQLWSAAPPERGRYAVGSGDSFLAGLLTALDRGDEPADTLALATAAATANTRAPGAAVFDPSDVASIRARVEVRRLPAPPGSIS